MSAEDDPFLSSAEAPDSLLAALAAAPDRPVPAGFAPGARLGRFEIVGLLGRGGFGTVFEARDTELGRHVAVKVMHRPVTAAEVDPAWLELFRSEAATGAAMDHPGLVTVHDAGVHDGRAYLVLELLRGHTLRARILRGPIPVSEALAILIPAIEAVAHAHGHGILHRDLKPENIHIGDGGRIKVLDFGLAQIAGAESTTLASAGTAAYMPPEQRAGAAQDVRTDVFALGVVLRELVGEGAPVFDAIVGRACAPDPDARFSDVDGLLEALRSAQRDLWAPTTESAQPYRFLSPFHETEADWFFGRGREIRRLETLLDTTPLATVVGPSGAGKSSLVRAGLVPRLRQRGDWQVLTFRPGGEPVARLGATLADAGVPLDVERLIDRPGLLGTHLRAWAARTSCRLLIVVDQLEELAPADRQSASAATLVAALAAAADDVAGPIRAVFTVRDDALGRLTRVEGAAELLGAGLLLLAPPDAAALRESLVGPAGRMGVELAPALVTEIVDTLANHVAPLPLLQLTASRLWARRDPRETRIELKALHAAGGVSGVLAAHADEVLRALVDADEAGLAMDLLVALCAADGTRRLVPADDLISGLPDPSAGRRVLDHLIAGRLLTASRGEVEVSHEALIDGWARLRDRLDTARDARRFAERVGAAARLWTERGQPRELLWRGRTLETATAWQAEHPELTNQAVHRFLRHATMRRRRWRATIIAVTTSLVLASTGITWMSLRAARSAEAEARAERLRGVVRIAANAEDPVVSALLLTELEPVDLPAGARTAGQATLDREVPLAVLRGHGEQVAAVAFSPDGRTIASASYDRTVRLWSTDGRGDPRVLPHDASLLTLAFTPDGRHLLSGGRDGPVWVWPTAGGPPSTLRGCRGSIYQVVAHPDGHRVAAACSDGFARVWDLRRPETPQLSTKHRGRAWRVALSPDGRWFASGGADHHVRLVDLEAAAPEPRDLEGHTGTLRSLAFSPDSASLASAGDDGVVRVWPVAGGPTRILEGHTGRIWRVAFSPDGRTLLSAGGAGTARLWPMDSDAAPLILRGQSIGRAFFSPDGGRVLTIGGTTTRLWPLQGRQPPRIFEGHQQSVVAAAFSPDGTRFATAADDRTLRVWAVKRRVPASAPHRVQGSTLAVALSADGRVAASGAVDGTVWTWPTGRAGDAVLLPWSARSIIHVALSPRGDRLAATSVDGTLRLGSADATLGLVLKSGLVRPMWIEFDPTGALLLASAPQRSAELWPADGSGPPRILSCGVPASRASFMGPGRVILATDTGPPCIFDVGGGAPRRLTGGPATLAWVAGSADGSAALGVGSDGSAHVWDVERPGPGVALSPAAEMVIGALDPSGTRAATATQRGAVHLWRRSGRAWVASAGPLTGHQARVSALTFVDDGRGLVSASRDGTVRLWDPATGRETVRLAGTRTPIDTLAVDRAGRTVRTASYSGYVDGWAVLDWPELRDRLRRTTTACLRPEDRVRLLGEPGPVARSSARACARRFGRSMEAD